jgi:SAM-dependent methyltransferase
MTEPNNACKTSTAENQQPSFLKRKVKRLADGGPFSDEIEVIIRFLKNHNVQSNASILDYGCGKGRNLFALKSNGFCNLTGVDLNAEMILHLNEQGHNCVATTDFECTKSIYDVVVLSHVIEHLAPSDLLNLLDKLLSRIKEGGLLIIATPVLSQDFYLDFDHIRPYLPYGIIMVFCQTNAQVQFKGRGQLSLNDIWFRRSPLKALCFRDALLKRGIRWSLLVNAVLIALFYLSFTAIGRTTGWTGCFQKKPNA